MFLFFVLFRGISKLSVCHEPFVQMADLQGDLERIKRENQKLRDTLDEVNTNYNALQMHFMNMMQERKGEEGEDQQEVSDGKVKEKKQGQSGGGVLVSRQFMDLGLASADIEPSSSSGGMVKYHLKLILRRWQSVSFVRRRET